ncbi:MAG: peptidylprolyl isomerase [Planctomycetes bacterium]|nr:peptidylprolyl isomerase [Planctomycetota bacterium]
MFITGKPIGPAVSAGVGLALFCAVTAGALGGAGNGPVPIIFDTDMGNDVDDALALAMIHTLADRGEAKLLAVTISKDNRWSAPYVDLVNTFYGRPDTPIGVVQRGPTTEASRFTEPVVRLSVGRKPLFPHDLFGAEDAPEAVELLRRTLARYPRDGEIVFVVVGFSTNLSRLLDSRPDRSSPLDGVALVARQIRLLSILAGNYSACRSKARGGDLGLLRRGRRVPAFEKAAFALKPGETSEIVGTRQGFHIIQTTERSLTYEKLKDEIRRQLVGKKISRYMRVLMKNVTINANPNL